MTTLTTKQPSVAPPTKTELSPNTPELSLAALLAHSPKSAFALNDEDKQWLSLLATSKESL